MTTCGLASLEVRRVLKQNLSGLAVWFHWRTDLWGKWQKHWLRCYFGAELDVLSRVLNRKGVVLPHKIAKAVDGVLVYYFHRTGLFLI